VAFRLEPRDDVTAEKPPAAGDQHTHPGRVPRTCYGGVRGRAGLLR